VRVLVEAHLNAHFGLQLGWVSKHSYQLAITFVFVFSASLASFRLAARPANCSDMIARRSISFC
jgi:hypothetical protein